MGKRVASGTNMVQYLVHHYVRAQYFQNKKQKADAAKHAADFETGWAQATSNERKTFDVIKAMTAIPTNVKWGGYEPIVLFANKKCDRWYPLAPKQGDRVSLTVWVPKVFGEKMSELPQRGQFIRDTLAEKLGIPFPKESA